MTTLQQHLYEYIEDERLPALETDGEFLLAQRLRNDAEKKLFSTLTEKQMRLFIQYTDAENCLNSIQLRYVFQETLAMVHDMLPL